MGEVQSFYNRINDYSIYASKLSDLPDFPKMLINTINQYSYCIAAEDLAFKAALQGSDVLLADGIGMVVAMRFLSGQKVEKIAGADLHLHLLKKLNEVGGRCFYLGSSESTLKSIVSRLGIEFPAVQAGYYSPPFAKSFSAEENLQMIEAVNFFRPDVLFIGMTAPKQEKWAFDHKEAIDASIICSIGAVFDFYAGTVRRPGAAWINLGLEWFIRLVKEPKRMWKRYLYYGPIFIKDLLVEKVARFHSFKN